jgi:hypothetical protein
VRKTNINQDLVCRVVWHSLIIGSASTGASPALRTAAICTLPPLLVHYLLFALVRMASLSASTTIDYAGNWAWTLDEAAIREDGGADGLAVGVDGETASQHSYLPPNVQYERVLWEATRSRNSSPVAPVEIAASAGWIIPQAVSTPPVFIAHTMLSAVWLLRQSLPRGAIADAIWAQLAQAAASKELTIKRSTPLSNPSQEPAQRAKRCRSSADRAVGTEQSDDGAVGVAVATVSNHNRQAEKERKAKRVKAAARRMEASGLVEPNSQAPAIEHAAHRSISPVDEPTVAWIIKQPAGLHDLFHTAKLPYVTANTMLQCARAIGNDTAKSHAACFVQNWRRSGNPLLLEAGSSAAVQGAVSLHARARDPFDLEWSAVTISETVSATAGVVYRWAMASLGRRYQRKIDELKAAASSVEDVRDRTVRSLAKRSIWEEKSPPFSWASFNARIKRSRRWYQAAETLGWGFLVLIPTNLVSPNWVEQTLRVLEWDIWLQLIPRVNAAAVEASRSFDSWLGVQGIEQGSLQGTAKLQLEVMVVSRLTEVADSDSEGGSSSDEGNVVGESLLHSGLRDQAIVGSIAPRVGGSQEVDVRRLFELCGSEG